MREIGGHYSKGIRECVKSRGAEVGYNEAYSAHGAGIEFYLRSGTERGGGVFQRAWV